MKYSNFDDKSVEKHFGDNGNSISGVNEVDNTIVRDEQDKYISNHKGPKEVDVSLGSVLARGIIPGDTPPNRVDFDTSLDNHDIGHDPKVDIAPKNVTDRELPSIDYNKDIDHEPIDNDITEL